MRDLFLNMRCTKQLPITTVAYWKESTMPREFCKVPGSAPKSILFGLEKQGSQQLIATAGDVLTDDSRLLQGIPAQPIKLKRYLSTIAGAFRNRLTRPALPYSIKGLWKADLFFGFSDSDRWVATTVKINPNQLEGARGLRIGIIPTKAGKSDRVRKDDTKNLVICPLHHDADFMQTFYEGFRIVQAFLASDANVPTELMLPNPAHREVAKVLAERREFSVVEVIETIKVFAQPGLLQTRETQAGTQILKGATQTDMAIAPMPVQGLLPLY